MAHFGDVRADGQVLVVTIDRQARSNALDAVANHELGEVFDDFERDPAYRVAIVTGAGDKAFCAGADLKQEAPSGPEGAIPPSGFGGLTDRFGRTKPVVVRWPSGPPWPSPAPPTAAASRTPWRPSTPCRAWPASSTAPTPPRGAGPSPSGGHPAGAGRERR